MNTLTQARSLQQILGTVVRRRWFFLAPVALCAVLALAAYFRLPDKYEATATIMISRRRVIDPIVSRIAVSPDSTDLVETLRRQVLTWGQMEKLYDELGQHNAVSGVSRDAAIAGIQRRISIDIIGEDDEIILIRFRDTDPESARRVANWVADSLIEENARLNRAEAQKAVEFIRGQLSIYRSKLDKTEHLFSAARTSEELRLAYNRREILMERLNELEQRVPHGLPRNLVLNQLYIQQGEMEVELARLKANARKGNPHVEELERMLESIKKRIAEEELIQRYPAMEYTLNPAYIETEEEIQEISLEIARLENRLQTLRDRGVTSELSEEELVALERDRSVNGDVYQMLMTQLEAAYVSEQLYTDSSNAGGFSILDYARVPTRPVSPNIIRLMFIGLLFGGGAGFGIIFTVERFDKSFLTVQEAKDYLDSPVIGVISRMVGESSNPLALSWRKILQKINLFAQLEFITSYRVRHGSGSCSPHVVMCHDPKSKIAEEFRVLRTNLLGHSPGVKKFLLTSTVRGEGKSITSVNLAVAMAYSGKKTIIADCDLRCGTINGLLGVSQGPGLSDVLASGLRIESAILDSGIDNLSVLSRGSVPDNPSELLGSERMKKTMEFLAEKYDAIVLDAPPVLNLSDARILANYADKIVYAVQMERTQRSDVAAAKESLGASAADFEGFVLTQARYYMPRSLYGYYYGK